MATEKKDIAMILSAITLLIIPSKLNPNLGTACMRCNGIFEINGPLL